MVVFWDKAKTKVNYCMQLKNIINQANLTLAHLAAPLTDAVQISYDGFRGVHCEVCIYGTMHYLVSLVHPFDLPGDNDYQLLRVPNFLSFSCYSSNGNTSILQEFMKSTMDLADLIGFHVLMSKIPGRGELKVLVAGLGMFLSSLTRLNLSVSCGGWC